MESVGRQPEGARPELRRLLEPDLGYHTIVIRHQIKNMALAARVQESRKAWLGEMLRSRSQPGAEINRLCVKIEHIWRDEALVSLSTLELRSCAG